VPSFLEYAETLARWRRFPATEHAPEGRSAAALTFDDGPDPDATPAVLDALDGAGTRATFFLVGEQVRSNPELAREVARRGHEVALHGYTHLEHDQLGDTVPADVRRGMEAVSQATGTKPGFFRPPYGRFSEASYAACRELGLEPVYWSAWGADWETISAERIAEIAVRDLADGTILVLHDSSRYAHRPSAAPTAEAIAPIAGAARARGLELRPLGEVVGPL
jgi:peptidoglycan/xylan/chitin deacetylase (PgdA/CDA1 family)